MTGRLPEVAVADHRSIHRGQELASPLIALAESVMKRFQVPGLAIGLSLDGAERLRGFGVTSIENPLPVDADTVFVAGSLTKPVVATAAMSLVGDGRLDLDSPVIRYLPDLKLADAGVAAAVTLRHLLTHTAGWVGDDFDGMDFGPGDDALARAIATFANRPQVLPLGSLWSYNNSAFWLAGRVIEVVTEMTLESAISELVLHPLAMTSSFFFESDVMTRRVAVGHNVNSRDRLEIARPWSVPRAQRAAGGLLTTTRDLMRFASLQLHDGGSGREWGSLPANASLMQVPQVPAEGATFAGLGWVVRDIAGHRVVSHAGDWNGQQSLITAVPDLNVAVCSLTNSGLGRRANDEIASWVLERYLGAVDQRPVAVEGDDSNLNALVGSFAIPGKSIQVERQGRRLRIRYTLSSGPGAGAQAAFEQEAALTDDGRIIILEGPFEGITGDFGFGDSENAAWIRLGGRVHPRGPAMRTRAS